MNILQLKNYTMLDTKATSSKGNQPKWLVNGVWSKGDYMGYEGLSECIVSKLLHSSNVENFVDYGPLRMYYMDTRYNGCFSKNFKDPDDTLITLERLGKQYLGHSFADELNKYTDLKEKIKYTVEFIERYTNLKNVGAYITQMLELDCFFLNEDRHTNNIAFIYSDKTGKYSYCPYFDFGLALLADTTVDYKLDKDVYRLMAKAEAKPFCTDFDEQVAVAEGLYGQQVKFSFTKGDVETALEPLTEYYDPEIIKRVRIIIFDRMNTRRQYFK